MGDVGSIEQTVIRSENPAAVSKQTQEVKTRAAQKDTARELGAKLASLRGIVWVGVVLFLLGLATLFYPPLKLIVGSVTTSCAMIGGGLALMILPSMVVGNELLILGCVLGVVAVWFFAYRHGNLRGLVAASQKTTEDLEDAKQPPLPA
ncbi:MAG: hypothetical protein WCS94_15960 [Verrucomicrobiota bacterium]